MDSLCPTASCKLIGMKIRHLVEDTNTRDQTIMQFGQARLIQTPEGKLKLLGGSKDDHTEAKEYISLFMHEAVVSFAE